MKIPHFRGVFCLNELPKKVQRNEIAVINLDRSSGSGTHWVTYVKRGKCVYYYDSFGNLQPPKQLKKYFTSCKILYNYEANQTYTSVNCGHLCLQFINNKVDELF